MGHQHASPAKNASGRTHDELAHLLVSHRFSTVRMADVIVVLDGGCVIEQVSDGELMARGRLYADLSKSP
ncbi:hypothetical protein [Micromonospora sp. DPT]|uniref:hypothetical protein n=1 Tax=Micromonospora sp. DPT TaxID=3142975 RepID=UPI00320A60A7